MPYTIDPLASIDSSSRILAVAFSSNGEGFATIGEDGMFKIYNLNGVIIREVDIKGRAGQLKQSPEGGFIVGSIENNVHYFSDAGEEVWQHESPGGVEDLVVRRGLVVCLSGAGHVDLLETSGKLRHRISDSGCTAISVCESGRNIALILDDASVRVIDQNGNLSYLRPSRCEKGEHVTACIFDSAGQLIVGREAVGMVGEHEDEVEVEWWNPLGQMVGKAGLRSRCTALTNSKSGLVAGTSEGEVVLISGNDSSALIWKFEYAISALTTVKDDLLVGTWFFLYRIPAVIDTKIQNTSRHSTNWDIEEIRRQKEAGPSVEEGREAKWQIEHSGIIEMVELSEDRTLLLVGGEDRNDYTGDEPVLLFDLNCEIKWREDMPDEEDPWLADIPIEMQEKTTSDAGTYNPSETNDDYLDLLSAEEKALLEGNSAGMEDESDLLSELNSELTSRQLDNDAPGNSGSEEESDFDAPLLSSLESDDLLASLSEGVAEAQLPPYADAGEQQFLVADDNSVTTALLDGSGSFDPHGKIVEWIWNDSRGRVIGKAAKIRVKLPLGHHKFDLSVKDTDDVWTTDSTVILVE